MAKRKKSINKTNKIYLKDVVEVVIAFLLAWSIYQGLSIVTGTPMPLVTVVGNSMLPNLHSGDLVFAYNSDDLNVGDIVTYDRPGGGYPIIHRIYEINNEGYITKGDNNNNPDPFKLSRNTIKGKVAFAVPLLGYPRLALYHVLGI